MIRKFTPASMQANPMLSQGAEVSLAGKMLFVSGQVGVDAKGDVPPTIGEQAVLAITNLNAVLADAGYSPDDIAKLTIFLTDETHLGEFAAAAGPYLTNPPPATTLLIVKGLAAPNLFVEIEATAVKN